MKMLLCGKDFDFSHKSYVMGILNVTPDSFSDGGRYLSIDAALSQVERMVEEGAAIIDVGGQSTRPGYEKLCVEKEIERVVPVIEAVKARFDIPVSLDTFEPSVARAGIAAGCDLINDIQGLRTGDMANVIAKTGVPVVIMHNRDTISGIEEEEAYFSLFSNELEENLALAEKTGIDHKKIILDPGIGFGKTTGQNLTLIRLLDRMQKWKVPVLLGASKKSFIGNTLDLPVEERLEGTLAVTAFARLKGVSIFRVHDVKENVRVLRMIDALMEL